MTCRRVLVTLSIAVLALSARDVSAQTAADKAKTATKEASAAAKASPELVGALSKEIGATPEQAAGALGAVSQVAGTSGSSASGLAAAASAFSKLGLGPDAVTKAVPVLTSFVSKSGGADVGKLLAGVLK
jgi:hypothetical protein